MFTRPKSMTTTPFHDCPGCTHGIIHRLIAEAIDELNVEEIAIGVAPVGCAVFAYYYWDLDMYQAAHGRAPAVATGIKRVQPHNLVFTYQGDGDLASIGAAEIIHAAMRGEKISVIFINNAIYGMTGGQMAPTTLVGQKTTTSPSGRDPALTGYPLQVCEMLATIPGAVYLERVSVHTPKNVMKARKAIKKAFQVQLDGLGFSMVEVLSSCPTNWGLSPIEALQWLEEKMIPQYPLKVFRDPEGVKTNGAV